MDSLKENHLGTLILLVISLSGLTFYAIAETIHRQPWGTLCAFLGFGAFVCFMCLMPLLHRRISLYRIGRDLETQRSQESFSLDQSKSTSLIDITCRLQTCRKRTNIKLVITTLLTVSLLSGTCLAYRQGEIELARAELQAIQIAKQADFHELEQFRDNLKTEIQKEVLTNLSNPTNLIPLFNRCTKMEYIKMYNCITNIEYRSIIYKYAQFLEKINTVIKYKLTSKPYIDNKLEFRIEYIKNIDHLIYDLYSSKAIQSSEYMQNWNSYHFENKELDEIVSKMLYLESLVSITHVYANISRTYLDFDVIFYQEFLSEYNHSILPM